MTLHNTELTLFASTIATGLGFAMITTSIGAGFFANEYMIATGIGSALVLGGLAFFIAKANRAVEHDKRKLAVVLAAFAAGVASVWFWLGPAQDAFLAGACTYDHFGACESIAENSGPVAQVAWSNDDYVVYQCELQNNAKYCRIAAAKRISHPSKFCHNIPDSQAFEVVEWCTPSMWGGMLVSRR